MRVCKSFTFEAAHRLPNYAGPCSRWHGHHWVLQVEISGNINSDGFVMDFSELKQKVNNFAISKLDHYCLNDIISNPTCELLLIWIYKQLVDNLPNIYELRLWETPDNFAALTIGDINELTKN